MTQPLTLTSHPLFSSLPFTPGSEATISEPRQWLSEVSPQYKDPRGLCPPGLLSVRLLHPRRGICHFTLPAQGWSLPMSNLPSSWGSLALLGMLQGAQQRLTALAPGQVLQPTLSSRVLQVEMQRLGEAKADSGILSTLLWLPCRYTSGCVPEGQALLREVSVVSTGETLLSSLPCMLPVAPLPQHCTWAARSQHLQVCVATHPSQQEAAVGRPCGSPGTPREAQG